mmetsp:Transcript_88354/g.248894  ORF Transcript_88354/g.248894 Transcript_88354/m.248894 type:complete len:276 (-) Transcript_88354:729-1556(-)
MANDCLHRRSLHPKPLPDPFVSWLEVALGDDGVVRRWPIGIYVREAAGDEAAAAMVLHGTPRLLQHIAMKAVEEGVPRDGRLEGVHDGAGQSCRREGVTTAHKSRTPPAGDALPVAAATPSDVGLLRPPCDAAAKALTNLDGRLHHRVQVLAIVGGLESEEQHRCCIEVVLARHPPDLRAVYETEVRRLQPRLRYRHDSFRSEKEGVVVGGGPEQHRGAGSAGGDPTKSHPGLRHDTERALAAEVQAMLGGAGTAARQPAGLGDAGWRDEPHRLD